MIERRIGGTHFHVSTKCRTERAALRQLEIFEADPDNYIANRDHRPVERESLVITFDLSSEYVKWMQTRTKPATRDWALNCARYLADWIEDLNGKDLRDVSPTADLRPALDKRRTSRKHRIEALKAFCSWLRREKGLMKHSEDPSLDVAVPNFGAAKNRRKRAVEQERVSKVLPRLSEEIRDIILLQTATAWHTSEVARFAKLGEIVIPKNGSALAVLITPHKSGELTRTPLQFEEHLKVAHRIRARGRLPDRHRIAEAMTAACEAAEVEVFHSGDMRHTVLTWAHEDGAPMHDVAAFAHHRSERTTRTFYVDVAEPAPKVPIRRFAVIDGGKKAG